MKGGSRSVSRRAVVAFFVLLYRTQPNNTVFWNQKTIPKLFRPPLFNTGHLRFDFPERVPPVSGKRYPQFREQKTAEMGLFLPSFGAASTVQESNCFIGQHIYTLFNIAEYILSISSGLVINHSLPGACSSHLFLKRRILCKADSNLRESAQ